MNQTASSPKLIRVKLLLRSAWGKEQANLLRRFPGGVPVWGGCEFILDYAASEYDWLVVYDDLPPVAGERATLWVETLACPRHNTLLVTNEPSTIKTYGSRFLAQFGYVLTSQEPWVIRHPGAIFSQPALIWYYGKTDARGSFDEMLAHPPEVKSGVISTVCSAKQQSHTLHRARYDFIQALRQLMPELNVFGHGVRPIGDKAEALDPYRYHIAIENYVGKDHWTEKLSDPFLGMCLPFYHGCPNAEDYFPSESFIRIDIHQPEKSVQIIRKAIAENAYAERLTAIRQARDLVLREYGLFAVLSQLIEARHRERSGAERSGMEKILSRHALRRAGIGNAISYAAEKLYVRTRHRFQK